MRQVQHPAYGGVTCKQYPLLFRPWLEIWHRDKKSRTGLWLKAKQKHGRQNRVMLGIQSNQSDHWPQRGHNTTLQSTWINTQKTSIQWEGGMAGWLPCGWEDSVDRTECECVKESSRGSSSRVTVRIPTVWRGRLAATVPSVCPCTIFLSCTYWFSLCLHLLTFDITSQRLCSWLQEDRSLHHWVVPWCNG